MSTVADLEKRVKELEALSVSKDEEIRRLSKALGMDTEVDVEMIGEVTLDISSSTREMLDGARARVLLGAVFDGSVDCSTFTKIKFGTKSFGLEAADVAVEAIAKLENLVVVDLADIIAGRPEEEALEVLKRVCGALPASRVKELDLSDNALGEKGIRALEPVLRNLSELTKITFHNNGLSALSMELLASYLPTDKLESLSFDNNMSGNGGAIAIAGLIPRCPVLSTFRMSSSRVGQEGGDPIIQALSEVKTLRELNLSDCMFGTSGAENLANTLHTLPKLKTLCLRDTGLDEGVEVLLEALSEEGCCPELEVLDLSIMEINEETSSLVASIVLAKSSLKELHLDENELESSGAVIVAKSLVANKSSIEKLYMRTNQIGSTGAIALARAAAALPNFKFLELDDNQISDSTVTKVEAILQAANKIGVLGSMEDNMPEDDEDEVTESADEEDELVAMMGNAKLG